MDFRHRDYYLVGELYEQKAHFDIEGIKKYFPVKCKSKRYYCGRDKYAFLVSIPKWLSKYMENFMNDENIRYVKVGFEPKVINYHTIKFIESSKDIEVERKFNLLDSKMKYYEQELKL